MRIAMARALERTRRCAVVGDRRLPFRQRETWRTRRMRRLFDFGEISSQTRPALGARATSFPVRSVGECQKSQQWPADVHVGAGVELDMLKRRILCLAMLCPSTGVAQTLPEEEAYRHCGAACVACVMRVRERRPDVESLVRELESDGGGEGASIDSLATALRRRRLGARVVENPRRMLPDTPGPVILHLTNSREDVGHYVVWLGSSSPGADQVWAPEAGLGVWKTAELRKRMSGAMVFGRPGWRRARSARINRNAVGDRRSGGRVWIGVPSMSACVVMPNRMCQEPLTLVVKAPGSTERGKCIRRRRSPLLKPGQVRAGAGCDCGTRHWIWLAGRSLG